MLLARAIVFVLFVHQSHECGDKKFGSHIDRVYDCPNKMTKQVFVNVDLKHVGHNKIMLNGNITVLENVPDPFELKFSFRECKTREYRNCEYKNQMVMRNLCPILRTTKLLGSEFLKHMTPNTIECPIKPIVVRFDDALLDLSISFPTARLVKDEYWLATRQAFRGAPGSKERKLIWCQMSEYVKFC